MVLFLVFGSLLLPIQVFGSCALLWFFSSFVDHTKEEQKKSPRTKKLSRPCRTGQPHDRAS